MDKLELREKLINAERNFLSQSEGDYEEFLTANELDTTEVIDLDDQSHLYQTSEASAIMDRQIHEHLDQLNALKGLDFSPASVVRPGAIVKANDRYLIIGFSKPAFEYEGKTFIGVSKEAPIFSCINGKRKGDVCQFNQVKFQIQEIY
ncbi:hypothetical protein [Pontibacter sp. G13]|uniref:hypothetical protein n=1 Tax=Pontibacter sp. G13 TaxID=3074898 RepID=UPI00288BA521|nr:hypothetical protein [Pontibacter sp. G13]WNJ18303.1 hypothetical protein RJD25_25910 [Pontibacter sp. G13]